MSKTAEISVLTANRLGDGIVVFLDFEGAWSENLAEAVVARSPDEVRALQDRGTYDAAHNLVVEPYLVEVRETGRRPRPHPLPRARARRRPQHPRRRAGLRGARRLASRRGSTGSPRGGSATRGSAPSPSTSS